MWNIKSPVQDLNSVRRIHFLQRWLLQCVSVCVCVCVCVCVSFRSMLVWVEKKSKKGFFVYEQGNVNPNRINVEIAPKIQGFMRFRVFSDFQEEYQLFLWNLDAVQLHCFMLWKEWCKLFFCIFIFKRIWCWQLKRWLTSCNGQDSNKNGMGRWDCLLSDNKHTPLEPLTHQILVENTEIFYRTKRIFKRLESFKYKTICWLDHLKMDNTHPKVPVV